MPVHVTNRLQRRGRRWVYRRRVPVDLVDALGRNEIVRALRGVRTLEGARRAAALLDARVWQLFDAVRSTKVSDEELINRLCDVYLRRTIEADRQGRRGPPLIDPYDNLDGLHSFMSDEAERLHRGQAEHLREDAVELLHEAGEGLEGERLEALMYELLRTRVRALRMIVDERQGDLWGEPRGDAGGVGRPVEDATTPAVPSMDLSELIRRYVEDHAGKTWQPKTEQLVRAALAEFVDIVGDVPIQSVSKETIRKYKLTLEKLPVRRSLGVPIAKALSDTSGPRLAPGTIVKRMSYVIGLLRYAVRFEHLDKNPAEGMRPPKQRRAREQRDAFSDEDLRAVFGSDYREETLDKGNHARFWVPLLLLFTGARLEEIAQLHVSDVKEVDGIPCLDITERSDDEGSGKKLKNESSERIVPMHSELLSLGFLAYVEERRAAGDRRVFPKLRKGRQRGYGAVVSQWFTRWKRKHGVTSGKKVLHSFRHTVATRLKAADVQEHTISELLGHEVESMTFGRYGKRLEVDRLSEAVEKLDYTDALRDLT